MDTRDSCHGYTWQISPDGTSKWGGPESADCLLIPRTRERNEAASSRASWSGLIGWIGLLRFDLDWLWSDLMWLLNVIWFDSPTGLSHYIYMEWHIWHFCEWMNASCLFAERKEALDLAFRRHLLFEEIRVAEVLEFRDWYILDGLWILKPWTQTVRLLRFQAGIFNSEISNFEIQTSEISK